MPIAALPRANHLHIARARRSSSLSNGVFHNHIFQGN